MRVSEYSHAIKGLTTPYDSGYYYYSDYDHHNCGLFEGRNATLSYAAARGITANHLDILPPQSAYMGFWGVFDMRFWRAPPVMEFSDFMDSTALAYTNRLGEQAYYALVTALFVSPFALHQYAGMHPSSQPHAHLALSRARVRVEPTEATASGRVFVLRAARALSQAHVGPVHLTPCLHASPASWKGVGPFLHRGKEIIMGAREINNFNLIRDDVFCPQASQWHCNEIFECVERVPESGGGGNFELR